MTGLYRGGEGGIRTHGTVAGTPVFKTGSFNHSDTSPGLIEIVTQLIISGFEAFFERLSRDGAFFDEELAFASHSHFPAVAAERAIGGDDAMTGNLTYKWIFATSRRHSSDGSWLPYPNS